MLCKNTDTIYKELDKFQHQIMFGSLEDLDRVKSELIKYAKENVWHRHHGDKVRSLIQTLETRKYWETK